MGNAHKGVTVGREGGVSILLAILVDRLHSSRSLQAHFGLELGTEILSMLYPTHQFFILLVGYSLNNCPSFGDHL
ncbi:hypothetical protein SAMN02745124_03235 [Desulfofustis glycolicus DSM 9705]|uniref:Uncharacterized protein n=1 Tax=Desulfofustis glycolicus DSM 9705 TaxID=1121409 RepID=A0A1M5XPW1_9BACT|nr:hypothetical protein SAMN02745124_03235 [Desulfofustis glycolicus DSM 9705]